MNVRKTIMFFLCTLFSVSVGATTLVDDGKKGNLAQLEEFEKTGRCVGCDLRGFDLRAIIAAHRAAGRRIMLRNADIRRANLEGADLGDVHLEGVIAQKANFKQARLVAALARESNFEGADFTAANCLGLNAFGSNFRAIKAEMADFDRAHLQQTDFRGAELETAQFRNAKLNTAVLDGQAERAKYANFTDAELEGVDSLVAVWLANRKWDEPKPQVE